MTRYGGGSDTSGGGCLPLNFLAGFLLKLDPTRTEKEALDLACQREGSESLWSEEKVSVNRDGGKTMGDTGPVATCKLRREADA